jgi:hypothetical protein
VRDSIGDAGFLYEFGNTSITIDRSYRAVLDVDRPATPWGLNDAADRYLKESWELVQNCADREFCWQSAAASVSGDAASGGHHVS